jgi:membrane fusion protein (multidrug efflux system)
MMKTVWVSRVLRGAAGIAGTGVAAAIVAGAWTGAALAQGGQMPPPEVVVVEMKPADTPLTYEYAGRISAYRNVEVRARVSGILLSRNYTEGSVVKEGDVLFRIDPAPYEAALARAKAQLEQEKATLAKNEKDLERASQLFNRKVGTEKTLDDAQAAVALSKALIAAAEAQVRTAELDLGYTTVTAPIAGTTGMIARDEGSLVGTAADNSLLTRVTQLDPAYVNFSFTDTELAHVRGLIASGKASGPSGGLKVHIQFGDGQTYDKDGTVNFTEATIDQQTGTIRARAIVPNPDLKLVPGQFVRAIVNGVTLHDALVLPQAAVMQGPQGPFVYVVDAEGTAQVRPLVLGREVKGGWLVEKGLAAGDKVVAEGVIKVRPGIKVKVAEPTVSQDGKPAGDQAPIKKAEGPQTEVTR